MRRGKGTDLSDALRSVVSGLDRGGLYARSRVADAWEGVVGPEIAAHTAGAFLRDGELVIYVDSPVWATELASLSETLRTSLNEAVGEDLVSSVRFLVSRRVSEERQRQAEDAGTLAHLNDEVEPAPLEKDETERLEEALSHIEDDGLRAAVKRAEAGSIGRSKAHQRPACDGEGKPSSEGYPKAKNP